ncbi:MAG: FAD-dependent oxidoreductase [Thermodesulfobacteriota bacterium]|nr:FAD-dependent oxidoreductase [Thermodesulfobacteriota bacterium]
MDFVIIGGDAAGMSAASRAKRIDPAMQVTVLEKTEDVSYSACGMPYNMADAGREMDELIVRQAHVFREKQDINLLTGHCATAIDTAAQKVDGEKPDGTPFSFSYDKLLIATGASATRPDIPGIDEPGVFTLKTLEDGRQIKRYIAEHQVKHTVIIGMGYIGLEMAEALRKRDIAVEMIKPRPRLLPWMDETMADEIRQELEANDVAVHDGRSMTRIKRKNNKLAVINDDETLETDMIFVAVGVTPNTDIAGKAGIALGSHKEITVDRTLETSIPGIYAAGDCADAYNMITGQKIWKPLALRANRAGRAVGDNVCGNHVELPGITGTAVFKVFRFEVARTGLTAAEAETTGFSPVTATIKSRSRAHAHPGSSSLWVHLVGDKVSGRLLGAQMTGIEGAAHRINAVAVALCAGMTVADFAQSDMAYAPPFSPVWDPMLTAANQLLKNFHPEM